MFDKKRVVLQADLGETNRHLDRIATAFERIAAEAYGIDLYATTADMTDAELERHDGMTPVQEEFLAAIETLIDDGVPPHLLSGAFKRIGLDPPVREDEPTEREMSRPQPRPGDHNQGNEEDVISARRDDGKESESK